MLWLCLIICCRNTDPVLVGIPSEPLLEEQDSPSKVLQQKKKSATKVKHYTKPPEVIVDVQRFGGASFMESQPYLSEQLGEFVSKHTLIPRDGERRVYEKGEVRIVDDTIYMIRFILPEPMRRNKALRVAGFTEFIDKYVITHHEYQVLYKWDFVRFRMKREDGESELVTSFEAWKWIPLEQGSR